MTTPATGHSAPLHYGKLWGSGGHWFWPFYEYIQDRGTLRSKKPITVLNLTVCLFSQCAVCTPLLSAPPGLNSPFVPERGPGHHQPIRGQYPGHMITLSQSEASILVTWSPPASTAAVHKGQGLRIFPAESLLARAPQSSARDTGARSEHGARVIGLVQPYLDLPSDWSVSGHVA